MDIFVIDLSDANNIEPKLLEEFRHKEFINKEKQKEHCFSYLMLDRILKEVYHIKNREIEFINSKPHLKNKEKFFSISHSKEYIVIAFSDYECGVDIEKIVNRDYKALSERMKFSSTNLNEFYQEWTKFEAEYKLGEKAKTLYQTNYNDYSITAASTNFQEEFNIYIQNGEMFSNL